MIRTAMFLLCLWSAALSAQDRPVLRVLFLGNSYTAYHDLPGQVADLLGSGTNPIEVRHEAVTPGGFTLERHAADPKILRRIESGRWHAVVLQEQSLRPLSEPRKMTAAARELQEVIASAGAKALLFQTWPRANRPRSMGELARAYRLTAGLIGAATAPVGQAWQRVRKRHPEIVLYDGDGSHPAPAGTYLAACVIAAKIGDRDPRDFDAAPPTGVSEAEAEILRDIAFVTLNKTK
ncbi:hypothetical protein [Sulfidibacter corallicola]|uniref:SGNH/GDSL hydrolase family protein n=1 Tax=Sulfidibacter corallicola TaxID=2818388 RepID=A0A8A4TRC2_SULCO|nr:hypothetical protein [Sulfidibacter corallicola]QTD51558.1 hypothetical protein J3U87_03735 [Sulfidibacter corallicola]